MPNGCMSSIWSGVGYESVEIRTQATWPGTFAAGVVARPSSQPRPPVLFQAIDPSTTPSTTSAGGAFCRLYSASLWRRSALSVCPASAPVVTWLVLQLEALPQNLVDEP